MATPAVSRIVEPTTMLTDYLLTLAAGVGAWSLFARAMTTGSAALALWGTAFAAMALASATGGTVHGFAQFLGIRQHDRLWLATLVLVALASWALISATALASFGGALSGVVIGLAAGKTAVVIARVTQRPDFRIVLGDHGLSLLIVLALLIAGALRASRVVSGDGLWAWQIELPSSLPWLAAGVATTAVGGAIQWRGFALHRHFNHNDLFHVFQLAALWMYYRGGRLLVND